jgi:hypothetical protein
VDSARIEWGLSGIVSFLTNKPQERAIGLAIDRMVREIMDALEPKYSDPELRHWAYAITYWTKEAARLLDERGALMHSAWIVDSDVDPEDLVQTGVITSAEADALRGKAPAVYSRRLRDDTPIERSVADLSDFAAKVHEHMEAYPAMWFAAGIVTGLWPAPEGPPPPAIPTTS